MAAIIFDIDGTLIDTNPSHVEAWRRALLQFGHAVPVERIWKEIGKGGDKVVPALLGPEAEEREGEALRRGQKEAYLAIARKERFAVFPGAVDLLHELRRRGIRTALATSSNEDHLEATLASAGVDLRPLVDVLVTRSEEMASKPAPDLVLSAVRELGLCAERCTMVGDTVYDVEACCGAGVPCLAVLSGGTEEAALLAAGARAVWRDTAHLLADLDRALAIAGNGAAGAA